MGYPRFCQKHPTYKVRQPPRSRCRDCREAWELHEQVYALLRSAIDAIEKLYGAKAVTVRAEWRGGRSSVKGIRIEMNGPASLELGDTSDAVDPHV